jgi:hypothetical protein
MKPLGTSATPAGADEDDVVAALGELVGQVRDDGFDPAVAHRWQFEPWRRDDADAQAGFPANPVLRF